MKAKHHRTDHRSHYTTSHTKSHSRGKSVKSTDDRHALTNRSDMLQELSSHSLEECFNLVHCSIQAVENTCFAAFRETQNPAPPRNQPLLAEPRYGSAPIPYDNFGGTGLDPARRGTQTMAVDYSSSTTDSTDPYSAGRFQAATRDGFSHDTYGPPPSRAAYDPYHAMASGVGYGDSLVGNGPPGMYQQGCVLMVYGLNKDKMNAIRLFNLFCLYGNVVRIKFLKTKEGSAMIQMGDSVSCDRAIKNLHNQVFFDSKLQLSFSKQAFLQDVPNPHDLADGTPSFMDFMGNRNNRFTNPEAAAKNRIQSPSKTLYYWNAPPGITEAQINELFTDADVKPPSKIKQFPSRTEKSSTGLLEWDTKGDAIEALCASNHSEIPNPTGKYPYVFKLCFSSQASV
ncbi:hypothetical protein LSH36_1g24020 [Paralvinella palmiformis]|uniref:RRM domain-containing protein n=1 Tax=Paralvinella palmiformis TaxID=53620 RepID=A0AAD9KG64_9ANNE|nr:hypothetical protein LSH36_1g24020 [Paralvinella palmiformis]